MTSISTARDRQRRRRQLRRDADARPEQLAGEARDERLGARVTEQAQGVTVPNSAITGSGIAGTVDVLKNGKASPTDGGRRPQGRARDARSSAG